jgi:hypothetical protein
MVRNHPKTLVTALGMSKVEKQWLVDKPASGNWKPGLTAGPVFSKIPDALELLVGLLH